MDFLRNEHPDRVYGRTATGREYKCLRYHRQPNNSRKSCWDPGVTEVEESDFFHEAETSAWQDSTLARWWTSPDADRKIGTNGQRLAYFPPEPNASIPAHGYPVSTYRSTSYKVEEQVIVRMEASGRIDDLVAKKLRNQKL